MTRNNDKEKNYRIEYNMTKNNLKKNYRIEKNMTKSLWHITNKKMTNKK